MTNRKLSISLDERILPDNVALEVAHLIGATCSRISPINYGADLTTRLARVDLSGTHDYASVIFKIHGSVTNYRREVKNLSFINGLGNIAPKLLANDDQTQTIIMEFIHGQTLYDLENIEQRQSVAGSALRRLAELHCLAQNPIEKLMGESLAVWQPPDTDYLAHAWNSVLSDVSNLSEISTPRDELALMGNSVAEFAKDAQTMILDDVNPFNMLWNGECIRFVDIGSCDIGPAWVDLDIMRRLGLREAQIQESYKFYFDARRDLGNHIENEGRFLAAIDYWSLVSALWAAKDFQDKVDGRVQVKLSLPQELLCYKRFRDDVLSDVWAISNRRPELNNIARIMESILPGEICQERYLRGHANAP